jgi:hypothetical protein
MKRSSFATTQASRCRMPGGDFSSNWPTSSFQLAPDVTTEESKGERKATNFTRDISSRSSAIGCFSVLFQRHIPKRKFLISKEDRHEPDETI